MITLRVSLVQQSLEWQNPERNRERFEKLLAPLAGHTDLVVLPEMFPTGFSMDASKLAEPVDGPTTQWLRGLSRSLNAAVTGSLITVADGKHYNRMLWVTPEREPLHYDKRHLFRMANEHHHFTQGSAALRVEWRGFKICPLVCYDLRFPVFARRRADLDYDVLVYAANWPAARQHAWVTLLKARAIENQCFVVGVNRTGKDGKDVEYAGGSAAHDFLGHPLVELGAEAQVATATLDGEALRAFRAHFPAHLDADRFVLET
jgi:predicted amidohydrolase